MDTIDTQTEFLRPMHTAWLAKLEAAMKARERWKEISDECLMFYGRSAAAMWQPEYAKKFWSGKVKAPRFQITVNKAFELVAIFGPNLLWETPHRTVTPRKPLGLNPEAFDDPALQMLGQQMMVQQQQFESRDRIAAALMETWLNYTPREVPGGGLVGQSERAVVNALIKGRGILAGRPYTSPGVNKVLTGGFNLDPEDLLIDPDAKTLHDAKWVAIKHCEPHWEVEQRFRLPKNSLKDKSTLESMWQFSELMTTPDAGLGARKSGQTSDIVVWWEILSKMGCGCRNAGMPDALKETLEEAAGRFAYVAISPSVPYPLNCSAEQLRKGMSIDDVRENFRWPIESWKDNRWPFEVLDFYIDPESPWPMPPLQPAMGELKLLNFLIPWLCQRVWSSSRDFWAVARQHMDDYKQTILQGEDQTILPVPAGVDDVRKSLTILQQPETRQDLIRIIEYVSEQFDKRTGLMATAYGGNEGGTQNRTAEETLAKQRAIGIRPEYMQKQVVSWQSRFSQLEAYLTKKFVQARDTEMLLGPLGAMAWDRYVANQSEESIIRQFEYTVEAASIRRPNRERDIANFQQISGIWLPVLQQYAQVSNDYGPLNAIMRQWAKYHDADLSEAEIPGPQEPSPEQQQQAQLALEQMAAETEKTRAEVEKTRADAAKTMKEAQETPQQSAIEEQLKMAMELQSHELQMDQQEQEFGMGMQQQAQKHQLDMEQARQKMELEKKRMAMQAKKPTGATKK